MNLNRLNILHADDDTDDRLFFKEALEDLQLPTQHIAVNDGEQLMHYLRDEANELPHVLFLDINMPRKNGLECLKEIKVNTRLKQVTIIIFSTAYEEKIVSQLYTDGAQYYIRKPAEFSKFKKVIQQTFMSLIAQKHNTQPSPDNFVLTG